MSSNGNLVRLGNGLPTGQLWKEHRKNGDKDHLETVNIMSNGKSRLSMRGVICIVFSLAILSLVDAQTTSTQPSTLGPAFRAACWKGDLAQVTSLLAQGAPLEERDELGRTPLFLACHGDPDVVKFLLSHGARIDAAENDGDLPIAHACEFGDLASAQMLLDAGADFSQPNKNGHTPLILAAREGHDALVALLISHHVDVNYNGPSCSALYFAIFKDHLSAAKLLLDAGADPHVLTKPSDPKASPATMLTWAAITNDFAMIDLLLAHGADLNCRSGDGTTPLMNAMRSATPETVGYLLDKGADVNLQDNKGETALMFAILFDHIPTWQRVVQGGAKLETQDKLGWTVLIHACRNDYAPAIRFLMDQGADVQASDPLGNRALTYVANHGDNDMEQLLQSKGARATDIHILFRQPQLNPLPPARLWALAVGAIYAQTRGVNPEILEIEDPADVTVIKEGLERDWDVTDATGFLKTLDDLQTVGHRTFYQQAGAKLAAMSDEEFSTFSAVNAFIQAPTGWGESGLPRAIRDGYRTWTQRTGLAWDLCRYANLIKMGYAAGYIDDQQAWERLMNNARQVQSSFGSWQEMNQNFLDARQIWAQTRDEKYDAVSKLLLNPNDPNSPWNQLPWKTDLTAN
jgi:ankyrin repeat protein